LSLDCIDHGKKGTPAGYLRVKHGVRNEYLHRVAFAKANQRTLEEIAGVIVRHTCDNSRCINPEHLVGGSQLDNVKDQIDRQRNRCLTKLLTDAQKETIIRRYIPHDKHDGMSAMAREFKVSTATIHKVIHKVGHVARYNSS
jgi:hypothetical protein